MSEVCLCLAERLLAHSYERDSAVRDVEVACAAGNKTKTNIEVWLSLVERYVREQITDYERKNSKTAENP